MNLKILSVAVFCLIAIGPAQAEKANKAGDAEIEKKLEQIVALRARVFEEQRLLAAEGRRRSADVSGAEIALCRAHIALARERDQPALVIQQLKRAEALFRHKLESAKLEVEMGQADTTSRG